MGNEGGGGNLMQEWVVMGVNLVGKSVQEQGATGGGGGCKMMQELVG